MLPILFSNPFRNPKLAIQGSTVGRNASDPGSAPSSVHLYICMTLLRVCYFNKNMTRWSALINALLINQVTCNDSVPASAAIDTDHAEPIGL